MFDFLIKKYKKEEESFEGSDTNQGSAIINFVLHVFGVYVHQRKREQREVVLADDDSQFEVGVGGGVVVLFV
eukprot:m.109368 g.109368  ORF g.109368 m.109368 type:complete len:72 (-) comp27950_c0_seq2:1395-1610(-)